MNWIVIDAAGAVALDASPDRLPTDGFVWLDVTHDEVAANPEALRDAIERLTSVRIFDVHLQDALNLQHPSYFDSTSQYNMLVFRKLSSDVTPLAETPASERRALQEIITRPITFFEFDQALVTVRDAGSRTLDHVRARVLEPRTRADPNQNDRPRAPARPAELMLRTLNAMVDRYLDLREPLTDRLDRWQHELLDPRRPFSGWSALLDARIELRKLENLSEGQYDALQEMRDAYLEETPQAQQSDAYLVRLDDVIEHIRRVLNHARRLESTAESAVQLHFSAATHQTNRIVRTLTAITAIFAPLTLITGIFGMNFDRMPLVNDFQGFGWTLAGMAVVAAVVLVIFWTRRVLERPHRPRTRWLR
jgi:magnesium transporter